MSDFDANDRTQRIIRLVQDSMIHDVAHGVTVEGYNQLYADLDAEAKEPIATLEAKLAEAQKKVSDAEWSFQNNFGVQSSPEGMWRAYRSAREASDKDES